MRCPKSFQCYLIYTQEVPAFGQCVRLLCSCSCMHLMNAIRRLRGPAENQQQAAARCMILRPAHMLAGYPTSSATLAWFDAGYCCGKGQVSKCQRCEPVAANSQALMRTLCPNQVLCLDSAACLGLFPEAP